MLSASLSFESLGNVEAKLNSGGFWRRKILARLSSFVASLPKSPSKHQTQRSEHVPKDVTDSKNRYIILYHISTSPFMKKINSLHTHSDLYHVFKKPAFSVDSLRLLAAIAVSLLKWFLQNSRDDQPLISHHLLLNIDHEFHQRHHVTEIHGSLHLSLFLFPSKRNVLDCSSSVISCQLLIPQQLGPSMMLKQDTSSRYINRCGPSFVFTNHPELWSIINHAASSQTVNKHHSSPTMITNHQ